MVSIIIPAFNEEGTIGEAVSSVITHPDADEVIVVDDGSSDRTAELARAAGAKVIVLAKNAGKAGAMDAGVKAAVSDIILFRDADVLGYTHDITSRMIDPVMRGEFDMYVGVRSRKTYWLNRALHFFPILSGGRAITRALWESLPADQKKGFKIEILLNYYAKKMPKGMGFELIQGTTHVIKEKKHGIYKGFCYRMRMIGDILRVSFALYIKGGIMNP